MSFSYTLPVSVAFIVFAKLLRKGVRAMNNIGKFLRGLFMFAGLLFVAASITNPAGAGDFLTQGGANLLDWLSSVGDWLGGFFS